MLTTAIKKVSGDATYRKSDIPPENMPVRQLPPHSNDEFPPVEHIPGLVILPGQEQDMEETDLFKRRFPIVVLPLRREDEKHELDVFA